MEVTTTAGRVRGFWRGASAAFLGIPFAEPPVGPLRFAAPVPHRPWDGVRDATAYGATPQRGGDGGGTLIPEPSHPGESTLNVNVFTPAPGGSPDLPVLVYLHGGGFVSGSPSSRWYDGAAFNRDGVVTVSASYRLGFEGFGWVEGAAQNRAVLDWLLALEWVRDNIAAFGGDPGRVTLAGQSAGGGAVLTLLGMPQAQHLFARAYSMSGVYADIPADAARATGRAVAEQAGVEPTISGFSSLSEDALRAAQDAAPSRGARGRAVATMRSMLDEGLSLGPVVDGELITRPTPEAYALGIGGDKPLLLSTAEDEFTFIVTAARSRLRFLPAGLLLSRIGVAPQVTPGHGARAPPLSSVATSPTASSARSPCVSPRSGRGRRPLPPGSASSPGDPRPTASPCTASTYPSSSTTSRRSACRRCLATNHLGTSATSSTAMSWSSSGPARRAGRGSNPGTR